MTMTIDTPIAKLPKPLQKHVAAALKGLKTDLAHFGKEVSLSDLKAQGYDITGFDSIIANGLERKYVKGDFIIGDETYFEFEPAEVKRLTFKKRLNHEYRISIVGREDGYSTILLHLMSDFVSGLSYSTEKRTVMAKGSPLTHTALGCDTAGFLIGLSKTYVATIHTMSDGYYADVYSTKQNEHMIFFSLDENAISAEDFVAELEASFHMQKF